MQGKNINFQRKIQENNCFELNPLWGKDWGESEVAIFTGNNERPGPYLSLGLEVKKTRGARAQPSTAPRTCCAHTALSALKGGLSLPLNVSNSGAELVSTIDYLLKSTTQCFMQVQIKRK